MFLVLLTFIAGLFLGGFYYLVKYIFGFGSISGWLNMPFDLLAVIVELILAVIVIAVVYFLIIKRYHLDWQNFGFRQLPISKTLGYIVLTFIITFGCWIAIVPFILILFPNINLTESQEIFQSDMTLLAEIMLIFYATIIGPFIEEITFRGVLLPAISLKFNPLVGIIISTLIWSLLHFQINVIIFTFIFGSILSYVVFKTKSLWPSYIAHVIKNLIAVIAIYILNLV
ncbi:CPBP family intramembrane metalloprotease [Patescibacteria group bacterium]|nr:CPBP family intramembrane metalloprotease [Patescibacteria group bacterium]